MQAWFSRPRSRLVAAAGRLSPEKGFDQFIAAAALVAKQEPEAGFVLFGEGPLRQALERQIVEMGLSDSFVLAGFHTDIQRFLPCCDLVILSSWTEGLPVIVLEALAAGVPVVATAAGGTPEIIDNGVNGFLVPVGKPAALAWRIAELLGNDALRHRMGQAGRKRVTEQFTFAAQSDAYEHLFRQLCRERSFEEGPESLYLEMHSKQQQ
jgi:glycosyltransferase involved in cell wall biosynthesis